ncbi:ferritin family protein [Desulfosoma caldarium]|uniref:Rubrerythrin n=1 Tax=Desulfosoma caldarium TaxID=610254 RepID=A0A3N1VMU3_9BACT|nr:ferritin family protein [Desulfosoma caldarium]ROR01532.1 rubrerythrin [Desulfosoma caldarium]
MFSAEEVLKMAVRIEENGEKYYRRAMKLQKNPSLRDILRDLAEDESRHAQWFNEMRGRLSAEEGEDRWVREVTGDLLQSMIGDQTFSLKEVDPAQLDSLEKILETALEFEKDSILFYDMLTGFMDEGESARALQEIIAEEKLHVEILEARLKALSLQPVDTSS